MRLPALMQTSSAGQGKTEFDKEEQSMMTVKDIYYRIASGSWWIDVLEFTDEKLVLKHEELDEPEVFIQREDGVQTGPLYIRRPYDMSDFYLDMQWGLFSCGERGVKLD